MAHLKTVMKFSKLLCFLVLVNHVAFVTTCDITIPQDTSLCKMKGQIPCENNDNPQCLNITTLSEVYTYGISEVVGELLHDVINFCCPCQNLTMKNLYFNTLELYDNITYGYEDSDFIFPILGTKSTKMLYGRYFIPVIDVDSTVLITPKINGTVMVEKIISSCLSLLPLFGICLLMALASGFIVWLLDTWSNEEQFPRNVISGVYEGFWWAFISMTTVGYGDKTPLSVQARLYGIFWIIVGITICSMLTASLTTIITSAGALPSTHITGKNIIISKHRLLDASFVLSNGGILLKELDHLDVDYELTNNKNIYGYVTDHITTSVFRKNLSSMASKYDFQTMPAAAREYNYGILVKDASLHKFLMPFFRQNAMLYEACILLDLGGHTEDDPVDPFHPDNGVFGKAVLGVSIICAIFGVVGVIFEIIRRKKKKLNLCKKSKKTEDDVIHEMRLLLQELSEIKKEKQCEIRF